MAIIEISQNLYSEYIPELVELLKSQMKAIGANLVHEQIKTALDNIFKPDSRAHLFAAIDDSTKCLTALCLVNIGSGIESGGDYLWINEIHVKEEVRRSGIGRDLLRYIIDWGKQQNCRYALAMTSPDNEPARGLCLSLGFETSDITWLSKKL